MNETMKEACPHCNNIVEGKFSASSTRKFLTGLAKRGGMKAVLACVGSALPGIGNVGGFLAGGVVDFFYGDDIKKYVDKIADIFDDNKVYVFDCPNCGHSWARKEDEISGISTSYDEDELYQQYTAIFERVRQIIADKLSVDENEIYSDSELAKDLGADSLDAVELVMEMEKEFGIKVPDEKAEQIVTVWDIVSFIGDQIIDDDDDDDDYDDDDEEDTSSYLSEGALMLIEDVFDITGRGTVATGRLIRDVAVGDEVEIIGADKSLKSVITGIEMFRKLLDRGEAGDNVGLLLRGVRKKDLSPGMVICVNHESVKYHDYEDDEYKEETSSEITEDESEYIEELKACLEDGEISRSERRLLEKLRVKLGISESRAAEIEAFLSQPQLSEAEQEYFDEYKECLSDGGQISAGERRLLNRLRTKLGISEQRASELEKLYE